MPPSLSPSAIGIAGSRRWFRATLLACVACTLGVSGPAEAQDSAGAAISLRDASVLALSSSPDLASAESAVRAREGAILQAGRRPNPELGLVSENLGGDRDLTGGAQSTLSLGQRFELGGKRAARVGVAEASRDMTSLELNARRSVVLADVARRFIDVMAAQRRVELADQAVGIAEETAGAVGERVTAGKVSPIEETRAGLVVGAESLERERARSELTIARQRLAGTWGGEASFSHAEGRLDELPPVVELEQLLRLIDATPAAARWGAEVAWRESIVELERSRAVPDITVGAGYRQFDVGTQAAVVSVTIPLPFADRNRGARIEASEELLSARAEQRSALVRGRLGVTEAHATLRRATGEVATIRSEMLPAAESTFAAVSEGYRLGKFGLTEMLDARRSLTAVRLQILRAATEAHQAAAEIERLTRAASSGAQMGSDDDAR